MATNEHYAIAHDTSVTTIQLRADKSRQGANNEIAPVATSCEKRGVLHTIEIQLAAVNTDTPAMRMRMRIGAVPAVSDLVELIANGRDVLESNSASPVRVNVSEDDYEQLLKQIADRHQYPVHTIQRFWLAGVRVEKSTRTTPGRLQLIGADGSVLSLNWAGNTCETATLPSTIHPVDVSSYRE